MRVLVVRPPALGVTTGNEVTAARWARILRELGHEAKLAERYDGQPCDLLLALHAARCAHSVLRYREARPAAPLVVALTGTDIYRDIDSAPEARAVMASADVLVALQPLAARELPGPLRGRVRTIVQSADPIAERRVPREDRFEVCVLAHLRAVKDPLCAALAARQLPGSSRLHVLLVGAAIEPDLGALARAEAAGNRRFTWLGELPRAEALRVLSGCRALVLSSRLEGGANAISEAVVHGVPPLATRIPGSVGLLGEDYPGYFSAGDVTALTDLLGRIERDPSFLDALCECSLHLAPQFAPEREREAWRRLLDEL